MSLPLRNGSLSEADNPHKILATYAEDLDIVVFNGQVHTRDLRGRRDKIPAARGRRRGTGPILAGRTSIEIPAEYPPNLYSKPQPANEEYSYVLVDVEPGQKTNFTVMRFRP